MRIIHGLLLVGLAACAGSHAPDAGSDASATPDATARDGATGSACMPQNVPFGGFNASEIAVEAPSAGDIQSIVDESTAPVGVTFYPAAGEANALSIGDLAAGANYGVWVRRVVSATTSRYADNYFTLAFKADTA